MKGPSRIAVIVAGMHRSGTSALTRAISLLGADLAADLLEPQDNNNARGFWEPRELVTLSDQLLAALGTDWSGWDRLPRNWQQTRAAAEYRAGVAAFVEREFAASRVFVLKDPRTCRILPALTAAVEPLGIGVRIAIPYRNPAEVVGSLYELWRMPAEHALLLWLRYALDVERMSRGYRRSFVAYADLLVDWKAALKKLRRELGLRSRLPLRGRDPAVAEFLSIGERHHDLADGLARVHPWVADAWDALKRLDRRVDDKPARTRLDRIAAKLDRKPDQPRHFAGGLAPWSRELSKLRAALQKARAGSAERDERLRESAAAAAAAAAEIEALRSEIAELQQRASEREAALAWSLQQGEAGTAELARRNAEIAELQQRLGELQQQLVEQEARNRQQIGELQQQAGERQQQLAELQDRLGEHEAALDRHATEAGHLNAELAQRGRELADLQRQSSQREQDTAALQERLGNSERALRDERAARRTAESAVAQAAQEHEAVKRDLEELVATLRGKASDAAETLAQELAREAGSHRRLAGIRRAALLAITATLPAAPLTREELELLLLVAASGLFEAAHYAAIFSRHGAAPPPHPLEHFVRYGMRAGLDPSPLFDTAYYLRRNPDLDLAGTSAFEHFLRRGGFECRAPNPMFDCAWYVANDPAIAATGLNPLVHWLRHGAAQGRAPSPYLDLAYYARRHPEAAADPLRHFLVHGAAQRLRPNPLFDIDYYYRRYPDAAASQLHPIEHYAEVGAARGYKPSPYFDSAFYREKYPDVAQSGINPLRHYLQYGKAELRQPNPLFDPHFYLETHPDIRDAGIDPLTHLLEHGAEERRRPHPDFDPQFYLGEYRDLDAAECEPLAHFLDHGVFEGRRPNPFFDAAAWRRQHPDAEAPEGPAFLRYLRERDSSVAAAGHGPEHDRPSAPAPQQGDEARQQADSAAEGVEGHFDAIADGVATGWARDRGTPQPVRVELLIDGEVVDRKNAGLLREDLVAAGIGSGRHAFRLSVPPAFADGQPHRVAVRIAGTPQTLPGLAEPRVLGEPPAPRRRDPADLPLPAINGKIPLSVIMPTYNRGEQMERSVRRYLQCAERVGGEVIVIDDGSRDDTPDRLKRLVEEAPMLVTDRVPNAGQAGARNLAASMARGEVLVFVGDDVMPVDDDFLAVHLNVHQRRIKERGQAMLGKISWPDATELPVNFVMAHVQGEGEQQFGYRNMKAYDWYDWRLFYSSNVSVKRNLVADWINGGFEPSFHQYGFEDAEFALRMTKRLEENGEKFGLFYVPAAEVVHYHPHNVESFLRRQVSAGMMAHHFLELHPDHAKDLQLDELQRRLNTPPDANDFPVEHYMSMFEGLKSWALVIENHYGLGSKNWHGDFLRAVFHVAFMEGYLRMQADPQLNLAAGFRYVLEQVRQLMHRVVTTEVLGDLPGFGLA